MSKCRDSLKLSLQFFADGGENGEGAEGNGGASFEITPRMAELQKKYNLDFGTATGAEAEGEVESRPATDEEAAEAAPTQTAEERFSELINGEFKEVFERMSAERTEAAIKKRFKARAEESEKTEKYEKALSRMARHYGKEKSDFAGIAEAAIADDKWFEDEAFEKNTSAKALREAEDTNIELERLRSRVAEQEKQAEREETYRKWHDQSVATREKYPSFDESKEFSNPEFIRALAYHKNVEAAYVATHFEEILGATARAVEERTRANTTRLIEQGKSHPKEGAVSSHSTAQSEFDPSKLSRKELADLREKIARGEQTVLDLIR